MSIKKILFGVGLLGLVMLRGIVSPALACDPSRGDWSDCPTATPTVVAYSTVVPTAVSTLIASSAKPGSDTLSLPSGSLNPETFFPLACLLPDGDNSSNALGVADLCPALPVQVRAVKAVPTPVPAPKAVVAPTPIPPKGDSPGSAKAISDVLQTIDAGAVQWYKIDNGRNFFLDVYLDANGASGITLALYAPEQANELSVDLKPKGRGGPVKNEPHDLLWKGSFATGVWYALVRNYNATPMQYNIGLAQSTTDRNCSSYWESVQGTMTFWTDCGHYTDTSKK